VSEIHMFKDGLASVEFLIKVLCFHTRQPLRPVIGGRISSERSRRVV
jgi:hypothetical protein